MLGPLEFATGGGEVALGPAKQRLLLLSLLATEGVPRSTDQLIDDLWGDRPPGDPRASLRAYLSNLRKIIEPHRSAGSTPTMLLRRGTGYVLSVDDTTVDARRFERHLEAARAATSPEAAVGELEAGLALWRGDAFGEAAHEAFAAAPAARLHGLRREAIVNLADGRLRLGEADAAITLLEATIATDPLDEGARRRLAVALYAAGRQRDALASIRATRDVLLDEFGLDPGPELTTLERRILDHDPSLLPTGESRSVDGALSAGTEPGPARRHRLPGRTSELAAIADLQASIGTTGSGSLVIVSGAAGTGKTRLAEEVAAPAVSRGETVVWARSDEGADGLPLWPWASALRDLIDGRSPDESEQLLGSDRPPLEWFVPGLADTLADPAVIDGTTQFQAFDATVRVIRRLAESAPLIWVLDDLHWADARSIELLGFLARRLADIPVLVIATVRDEHLSRPEMAELLQLPGTIDLRVTPLDREALAELVEAEHPDLDPDSVGGIAAALVDRTAGNPFFALQLLRSLDPDQPIDSIRSIAPDGVAAAISARLASLPPLTGELLTIASAARSAWTVDVAAAVAGVDIDDAIDAVEAAAEVGLVDESPDSVGAYRFSHALVADAIYGSLSAMRRARLHAHLGPVIEAIRPLDDPTTVLDLTHHYCRGATAGTALEAARWSIEAARHTMRLHDPSTARRLVEGGLLALDHATAGPERDRWTIELLRERSEAERRIPDVLAAQQSALAAYRAAAATGVIGAMADAALTYCGDGIAGPTLRYWFDDDVAAEIVGEVLTARDAEGLGDVRRIRLWNRLADARHDGRPDGQASAITARSVALTRRVGDPQLLVESLITRCIAAHSTIDRDEHAALADEATTVAKGAGLDRAELFARRIRLGLAIERADPAAIDDELVEIAGLGARTDDDGVAYTASWIPVPVAILRGEFEQAPNDLAALRTRYEHFEDSLHEPLMVVTFSLMREQHHLGDLVPVFVERHQIQPWSSWRAPLLLAHAENRRPDHAEALLATMPASDFSSADDALLQFVTPSLLAEAVSHLGLVEQAAALVDLLEPHADRLVNVSVGTQYWGWLGHHVGRLCTVLERFDDAERHLSDALDRSERVGSPPSAMRCRVGLAELRLARTGDGRTEFTELAAEARSIGCENTAVWADHLATDGLRWASAAG